MMSLVQFKNNDDILIIGILILLFKENNNDYCLYLILALILFTK